MVAMLVPMHHERTFPLLTRTLEAVFFFFSSLLLSSLELSDTKVYEP